MALLRGLSVAGAAAVVLLALSASAGQHQHAEELQWDVQQPVQQQGPRSQEAGHAEPDASAEGIEAGHISKGGLGLGEEVWLQ